MPALGADMDEGTLVEWLVKPGDEIHKGDIIAVVDTAKSAIEVESFHTGTIERLVMPVGETVPVGTVLAVITEAAPAAQQAAAPPITPRPALPITPRPVPPITPPPVPPITPPPVPPITPRPAPPATLPPAPPATLPAPPATTPLVRHEAEELGVDLAAVHGTGRGGRIIRVDVEHAAAARRVRAPPRARRLAAGLGRGLGPIAGSGPGGALRETDRRQAAIARRCRRPSNSARRYRAVRWAGQSWRRPRRLRGAVRCAPDGPRAALSRRLLRGFVPQQRLGRTRP